MKDHYTQALLQLLETKNTAKEVNAVLEGLKNTLEARGHAKLLPSILRAAERTLPRDSAKKPILVLAKNSAAEIKKYKDEIESLQIAGIDDPVVVEDSTIIGGYKVKTGELLIDGTHKTKLVHLYRTLAK